MRAALDLASEDSRSPNETRMRLVWVLDAGLPVPAVNQPVYDLDGRLLGVADLLDVAAGVVGEYDGEDHATHNGTHTTSPEKTGSGGTGSRSSGSPVLTCVSATCSWIGCAPRAPERSGRRPGIAGGPPKILVPTNPRPRWTTCSTTGSGWP